MSNISFDMQANDENVQKTLVAQQKEIAKLTAEVAKMNSVSEETKKLTKEQAAAQAAHNKEVAEAQRVIDGITTSEERHAKAVQRLNELKQKGLLTSVQHAKAIAAEDAQLKSAERSAGGFANGLGMVTGKLAAVAGGFLSAQAAIAAIRQEYDQLIQRQNTAKMANLDLAAEHEALIPNMGAVTKEQAQEFFGKIRTVAQQRGVGEAELTRVVNETMAAKGNLSNEDVLQAVEQSLGVKGVNPGNASSMSAAILDVRKQTGMDAPDALGYLHQLQAQMRVKSMEDLAANIVPAVNDLMKFGMSPQEAGAMTAALGHGMNDTTGAVTRTSAINLAKQLREYGSAEAGFSTDPAYRAQVEGIQAAYKEKKITADERDQMMQAASAMLPDIPASQVLNRMMQDPQYRENFLRDKSLGGFGASFEAQAITSVEGLLSGGKQQQQYFAAGNALMAPPNEALNLTLDARKASIPIQIAEADRVAKAAAEQMSLADVPAAISATFRDALAGMRTRMPGQSATFDRFQALAEDMTSGGNINGQQVIAALERDLAQLESGKTDSAMVGAYAPRFASPLWSLIDDFGSGKTVLDSLAGKNQQEFAPQAKAMRESLELFKQMVTQLEAIRSNQQQLNTGAAVANKAKSQKE